MSIEFKCPKCKRKYSVNEKYAGKKLKCKNENCGTMMQVPEIVKSQGSKVCPSCSVKMTEKSVVCVKCGLDLRTGQKLPAFQKQPKEKKTNSDSVSNNRNIIFAGIGIVVICFVIAIVAFTGNDDKESKETIAKEEKAPKHNDKSDNVTSDFAENDESETKQIQSEEKKHYLKVLNGSLEDRKDFLNKYPDSVFADEIKLLINNDVIGIENKATNAETEEQIIENKLIGSWKVNSIITIENTFYSDNSMKIYSKAAGIIIIFKGKWSLENDYIVCIVRIVSCEIDPNASNFEKESAKLSIAYCEQEIKDKKEHVNTIKIESISDQVAIVFNQDSNKQETWFKKNK